VGLPRESGLVLFSRPGCAVGVLPGKPERFASTFRVLGYAVGVLPGKPERFASTFGGSGADVELVFYPARRGNAATEVGSVATSFDDAAIQSLTIE
jgi:hypothetical protein